MFFFFFFNDTATTEIYTLSLHDALPILFYSEYSVPPEQIYILINAISLNLILLGKNSKYFGDQFMCEIILSHSIVLDRKSTRLNSSHSQISYAVFCLKKKNITIIYKSSG